MKLKKYSRVVLLSALGLAWGPASADPNQAIVDCAAVADKDDQIRCLEAAILRLSGDADDPATSAQTTEPEPEAQTPSSAVSTVEETLPAALPAEPVTSMDIPAAEMASPGDELGAEQVALRSGDSEEVPRVQAMVIEHAEVGYRKVRVRLDNGQTWQQTDGDRIRVIRRLRDDPSFTVELWKTKSGGYRMYIPSKDITLRVKRLQ